MIMGEQVELPQKKQAGAKREEQFAHTELHNVQATNLISSMNPEMSLLAVWFFWVSHTHCTSYFLSLSK